jgi:hypothetical protein
MLFAHHGDRQSIVIHFIPLVAGAGVMVVIASMALLIAVALVRWERKQQDTSD